MPVGDAILLNRAYLRALGEREFTFVSGARRIPDQAVVEDHDGSWIGIEVKLSWNSVEHAAHNLVRVAAKMTRPPNALVIVVPDGHTARTEDGVLVVPLSTLGP